MAICPTRNEFLLSLADGTRLILCAGDTIGQQRDETAARVLDFLARAAQLSPAPTPPPTAARRLLVVTDVGQNGALPSARKLSYTNGSDAVCVLADPDAPRRRRRMDLIHTRQGKTARRPAPEPLPAEQWLWQQLVRLSAAIARETQPRGGVLLHSGLAQAPHRRCGASILLAGRSGVGKSTASRRLPPPWRALADDMTLVVRDTEGVYWTHPWPTWSRFFGDEAGDGNDTWDVQRAVPLQAIVVLEQGSEDRIEPLGPGHAVALLSELAQQASRHLVRSLPHAELAAFHRQRFDNLCALARTVPAYLLHVSLDGAFWTEIERVIEQQTSPGSQRGPT
ncbi:MAG: SynChlorMet cassette protein ScmC [Chloroflexi bacterium]|nr:SynChlorMet cassette protein ScmC [Chloroflexota bacterium]MBU1747151.1 SynChlorMet cassette protein ScmC [Chloroflexota bacterium]